MCVCDVFLKCGTLLLLLLMRMLFVLVLWEKNGNGRRIDSSVEVEVKAKAGAKIKEKKKNEENRFPFARPLHIQQPKAANDEYIYTMQTTTNRFATLGWVFLHCCC